MISGDEIISDSYDLKLVNDIVYEADCAMITEGGIEIGMCPPMLRLTRQRQPPTLLDCHIMYPRYAG